jgi:hypothetical protein
MSMLFRREALRPSCGRALLIFPGEVTDNILVIDARGRLCAVSLHRAVGAADRLRVKSAASKVWRRA